MQSDALLNFVQPGGSATAVGSAGAVVPIGNVIDLLGNGSGSAPTSIIGNVSTFGHDPGIGRVKPVVQIIVGTSFTTANSATAVFALQYAADAGSPSYVPGTWYISSATEPHAASVMVAGARINMGFTPAPPEVPRPRFIRLVLIVPSATNFNAGAINFAGPVMVADTLAFRQQPRNYAAA